jgi:predicted nucleic acid-binding protein
MYLLDSNIIIYYADKQHDVTVQTPRKKSQKNIDMKNK